MKLLVLLTMLTLVSLPFVSAATLEGTVYDFSLNKVKNVIVEINSIPTQKMLVYDGNYRFSIDKGLYNLTVKNRQSKVLATESVDVINDGTFNIDLFLFPDISEDDDLVNETNFNPDDLDIDTEERSLTPVWIISVIGIFLVLYYLAQNKFSIFKKKENKVHEEPIVIEKKPQTLNNEKDLSEQVIEIMKMEGNRITQKDLRKHFNFSEAKISLVISELESKGIVEKIKRGRGNIIILKH